MATVSKKPHATAPAPGPEAARGRDPWAIRALDAVYRFLASLKLAVILLTTLAAVLAYATFYESYEGTPAVQEHVYRSKGFALLMALLGVNILCAALIRFPWKRRQTGFVVTHAGLLIVLVGSFISIKTTDDGLVRLAETSSTATYIRESKPVFRVQKVDPHDPDKVERSFLLEFSPGAHAWETGRREAEAKDPGYRFGVLSLRLALGLLSAALLAGVAALAWRFPASLGRPLGAAVGTLAVLGSVGLGAYAWNLSTGPRRQALTDASDPFQLAAIDFLPASSPLQPEFKPAADGVPMLRVSLLTQPPGAAQASDAFKGRGWIASAGEGLGHGTKDNGPARIGFQYLDGPRAAEALAAFLDPPADPLKTRRARFHYRDSEGKSRIYDWIVEGHENHVEGGKLDSSAKSVKLPGSDLTATLLGVIPMPTTNPPAIRSLGPRMVELLTEMGRATRSTEIPAAVFHIRKGDGKEIPHIGWAGLPLAPTVAPTVGDEASAEELAWIDFYEPPTLGGAGGSMMGTFGAIDVVATKDGRFFYRAFGRDGLRGKPGPIERGKAAKIFGGDKMPMQVSFRVDEFLPSGKAEMVCKPVDIPKNQMDRANQAAKVAMTADGETREFWILRSRYEPFYEDVRLGDELWRISFDSDTRPLPFAVNLVDFDPSNDPGASARAAYRSDVFLTEPDATPMPRRAFADLPRDGYFHFLDRPTETFRKVGDDSYVPFDGGKPLTPDDRQVVVQPIPGPSKITMNRPLSREHWTFYQSEYEPIVDEHREMTGSFRSILTVRHDPAWSVVYGGCLLVVVGTFLQFYMRAGVFSDGGKKERQRAEARARRAAGEPAARVAEPDDAVVEDL
jgi:hypothetical protein